MVSESLRPIGAAVVVSKKSNVLGKKQRFFSFKVVNLVVGKNFNTLKKKIYTFMY